ncbi:TPA: hypothetical protein ACNMPM_005111 [Klebsiella pneumoniae]|nr:MULTISPECIES: hypothetical protein [Klebsiella]MDD9256871.1 hypothetical protein [Klebsiella variicola]
MGDSGDYSDCYCPHCGEGEEHFAECADPETAWKAQQDKIDALVEALESEKRICATWRKTAEANSEKLEKAQTINAAAEKLVRCKGRYHSEQNYRVLAALFGVKTPDLPPLDSESSAVTVKLPDDEDGQAYGFGKWSNSKLPATAGTMTIAYCEDAWRAAFEVFSSAAGIKVEAE